MAVNYGRIEALHGISLSVEEGELVTLIGANGAGKTTTMRAISGIRPLTRGSIIFDGQDITKMKAHLRVIAGIVQAPEGRGVFPGMTVQENLDMGHYGRTFPNKAEYKATLDQVYELFPRLAERRTQMGGTMSGGEQQMVAIGRALMARPRVLLLDEPSMGLAPMIIQQIFRIISDINKTGRHHPAGGAERPAGAVPLRPGLHPGNRRGRQDRPRPGTAGRPGDQRGLPRGRLTRAQLRARTQLHPALAPAPAAAVFGVDHDASCPLLGVSSASRSAAVMINTDWVVGESLRRSACGAAISAGPDPSRYRLRWRTASSTRPGSVRCAGVCLGQVGHHRSGTPDRRTPGRSAFAASPCRANAFRWLSRPEPAVPAQEVHRQLP